MQLRVLVMVVACATLCVPRSAAGQDVDAPSRTILQCAGQRISNIIVLTQPPYTDRLPDALDFVRRGMRRLHSNTQDDVVRRYLLFAAGDVCTEFARAESERILRAQPFLVDARIIPYEDENGEVLLEVETRDEFSVVAGLRIATEAPVFRGIRAGESNLMGAGVYADVQWRDGIAYDDLMGFRLVDHQFLGRRNIGRLFVTRAERGHFFGAEVLQPYYTDLQRLAWRAGVGGTRDYQSFRRPDTNETSLALRREYADVGAVWRVGSPGRLKLLGGSVSWERHDVDSRPVIITPDGFRDDPFEAEFPGTYQRGNAVRLNALAGLRRVRFQRVEGFDALTGVQDVRVGVQTGLLAGYGIPFRSELDRDLFFRQEVYAGVGSPQSFVGISTVGEARRDAITRRWDGILTSGRMAWYLKPWTNQLTLTSLEWGAGWNVQVPYQLTFADFDGGMMGYRNSRDPGSHRVVARVEQRWIPTPRTTVGDIGVAFFADAGRLWAGDAAFSVNSPVRATVGVGILAAVPRRSRRLFRVDFAFPVNGDPNAGFEVRFSGADRTRFFNTDPFDVSRARAQSVPRTLFNWP